MRDIIQMITLLSSTVHPQCSEIRTNLQCYRLQQRPPILGALLQHPRLFGVSDSIISKHHINTWRYGGDTMETVKSHRVYTTLYDISVNNFHLIMVYGMLHLGHITFISSRWCHRCRWW